MSAPRRGFVYWARRQMRRLDVWSCRLIWWGCWAAFVAHIIAGR